MRRVLGAHPQKPEQRARHKQRAGPARGVSQSNTGADQAAAATNRSHNVAMCTAAASAAPPSCAPLAVPLKLLFLRVLLVRSCSPGRADAHETSTLLLDDVRWWRTCDGGWRSGAGSQRPCRRLCPFPQPPAINNVMPQVPPTSHACWRAALLHKRLTLCVLPGVAGKLCVSHVWG